MSDRPLVCICIPTYNAAATICETLASILAQTYPNLVIHVSDNASSDATLHLVESMADGRVHIHRLATNIGPEENFNQCIRMAEGKYTAIFHADDVYEPDMVAKQVTFLESHPEAGAVFTEASLIDKGSRNVGEIRLPKGFVTPDGLHGFPAVMKAILRHSNFLICPSAMVRTSVYKQEIKRWRGDMFKSSADLDLWLRILQQHQIGCLPERLMRYRISDNQGSAKVRLGTERADFFLVLDHYLSQEPVRALLDESDLRHYRWLERRDRVMRATNLFITGQGEQSGELLHDIVSRDALLAAYNSKRGICVLFLGISVKLLTVLQLNRIGTSLLTRIKQVIRK